MSTRVEGFQYHFSSFLHLFVLVKLVTSSIWDKIKKSFPNSNERILEFVNSFIINLLCHIKTEK